MSRIIANYKIPCQDLQYCSFSSFLMIMVALPRRSSVSILFLLTDVPLRSLQKCWFRDLVKYSGSTDSLQGYKREEESETVAVWHHSHIMGSKQAHIHAGKLIRKTTTNKCSCFTCLTCFKSKVRRQERDHAASTSSPDIISLLFYFFLPTRRERAFWLGNTVLNIITAVLMEKVTFTMIYNMSNTDFTN